MKLLLSSAIALSLVLGASLDAVAQYSRKDYPSARTRTTTTTEPTASTAPSRNSPRTTTQRETTQATPAPAEVSARTTTIPSRTSSRRTTTTTTRGSSTAPTRPRYETAPPPVYQRTTVVTRPQRPIGYTRVVYYGGLNRNERRDLQNRLERRAEEVGQWDYELDAWEADLYGRDYRRADRFDLYYGYNIQRLLSERELCDWSDRLDDATRALANRERRLADADDRRYRNDRNDRNDRSNRGNRRGRGNGNGKGNNNSNSNAGGMCPPGW